MSGRRMAPLAWGLTPGGFAFPFLFFICFRLCSLVCSVLWVFQRGVFFSLILSSGLFWGYVWGGRLSQVLYKANES